MSIILSLSHSLSMMHAASYVASGYVERAQFVRSLYRKWILHWKIVVYLIYYWSLECKLAETKVSECTLAHQPASQPANARPCTPAPPPPSLDCEWSNFSVQGVGGSCSKGEGKPAVDERHAVCPTAGGSLVLVVLWVNKDFISKRQNEGESCAWWSPSTRLLSDFILLSCVNDELRLWTRKTQVTRNKCCQPINAL